MSKPIFDSTQFEINRALAALGLNTTPNSILSEAKKETLPTPSDIFSAVGADIEAAAMTIAGAMANESNPQMQLKAAELALRVHGIFKDLEDKGSRIPAVNITINSSGEAKTLLQVAMPTP